MNSPREWKAWAMGALLGLSLSFGYVACTDDGFKAGSELVTQKRFRDAIRSYQNYYVEHPYSKNAPEALWIIGNLYRLRLNDFKEAVEAYRVLIQRFPESERAREAQFIIGEIYQDHVGDAQQAAVEYQKIIHSKHFSDEEKASGHYLAANAYFSMGNFTQATIELNQLLEKYPKSSLVNEARLKLAHSLSNVGDCKNALHNFEAVARIEDEGAEAQELKMQAEFGKAICLEEQGKFTAALDVLRAIQEDYPTPRVVEIRIERLEERMREVQK